VSSAGMLVRRDVWDELGGFDPYLPLMRDDVDLCWRAWLAGHRVAVVPTAIVFHAEAAAAERRAVDCGSGRVHHLDRAGAMRVLLANLTPGRSCSPAAAAVRQYRSGPGLPGGQGAAQRLDEVLAVGTVLIRPRAVLRMRRARRVSHVVGPGTLRRLFPQPGRQLGLAREALAHTMGGRKVDREAIGRHRSAEVGSAAAQPDDLDLSAGGVLWRRMSRSPVALLVPRAHAAHVARRPQPDRRWPAAGRRPAAHPRRARRGLVHLSRVLASLRSGQPVGGAAVPGRDRAVRHAVLRPRRVRGRLRIAGRGAAGRAVRLPGLGRAAHYPGAARVGRVGLRSEPGADRRGRRGPIGHRGVRGAAAGGAADGGLGGRQQPSTDHGPGRLAAALLLALLTAFTPLLWFARPDRRGRDRPRPARPTGSCSSAWPSRWVHRCSCCCRGRRTCCATPRDSWWSPGPTGPGLVRARAGHLASACCSIPVVRAAGRVGSAWASWVPASPGWRWVGAPRSRWPAGPWPAWLLGRAGRLPDQRHRAGRRAARAACPASRSRWPRSAR